MQEMELHQALMPQRRGGSEMHSQDSQVKKLSVRLEYCFHCDEDGHELQQSKLSLIA